MLNIFNNSQRFICTSVRVKKQSSSPASTVSFSFFNKHVHIMRCSSWAILNTCARGRTRIAFVPPLLFCDAVRSGKTKILVGAIKLRHLYICAWPSHKHTNNNEHSAPRGRFYFTHSPITKRTLDLQG
jgi:hypothetical protein